MEEIKINNKGFNLVELVLTIAILGIMLAIAVPNFSYWLEKSKTKSFVYRLVSEINYARDLSRKDGQRVVVALVKSGSGDQNWTGDSSIDPVCCLIFEDINKNCKYDVGDKIVYYDKCKYVKIVKNQLSRNFGNNGKCAVFFPVGLPLIGSVTKTITVQSKNNASINYDIKIQPITGIASVPR